MLLLTFISTVFTGLQALKAFYPKNSPGPVPANGASSSAIPQQTTDVTVTSLATSTTLVSKTIFTTLRATPTTRSPSASSPPIKAHSTLSGGAIAGNVVATVVTVAVLVVFFYFFCARRRSNFKAGVADGPALERSEDPQPRQKFVYPPSSTVPSLTTPSSTTTSMTSARVQSFPTVRGDFSDMPVITEMPSAHPGVLAPVTSLAMYPATAPAEAP